MSVTVSTTENAVTVVPVVNAVTVAAPGPQGIQGETGATGATGPQGETGATGAGVPTGGTTGQVLAKVDGTDYNTTWVDASTGSGTDAATVNSLVFAQTY